MTKFQKQMLTIAAAGALTAVTALPAMAFENEFHGMYIMRSFFSNFDNGAAQDKTIGQTVAGTTVRNAAGRKMGNYIEQRARLQYIAKASDDLKLVTHFEMDTRWGGITDNKYTNSNDAGVLDGDGINLETKHVYLDFNLGKNSNVKLGLQPYKDTIKGLWLDGDLTAAVATTKFGSYTMGLGYGRVSDADTTATPALRLGSNSRHLVLFDNKFQFSKDTSAALSYYYDGNDTSTTGGAAQVHTLGLSAATKMGNLELSGFGAMQAGHTKTTTGRNMINNGYAANLAAKYKMGAHALRTTMLFASGDNNFRAADSNNAHRGAWVATSGGTSGYGEAQMLMLVRNPSPSSTDTFLRRTVSNVALATIGFDAGLSDKLSINSNAGFAWAPSSQDAPFDLKVGTGDNARNGSDFMGAEINTTVNYSLYKNLTLGAQAAYTVLGGYYKNSAYNSAAGAPAATTAVTPENPYTMRLIARYTF